MKPSRIFDIDASQSLWRCCVVIDVNYRCTGLSTSVLCTVDGASGYWVPDRRGIAMYTVHCTGYQLPLANGYSVLGTRAVPPGTKYREMRSSMLRICGKYRILCTFSAYYVRWQCTMYVVH